VLYKDSSMDHKWHEGQKKRIKQYKKWIKGEKPQELVKKKKPAEGIDVCLF
jgi:hypothetical protein